MALEKGRELFMSNFENFDKFGYSKEDLIFDYSQKRVRSKNASYMSCEGAAFHSEKDGKWRDIEPSSLDEVIMNAIMKK